MKIFLAMISLIAVFYVPVVLGQCATGVNTGGQCIPPDALGPYNGSPRYRQPQEPMIIWADRWGAIAEDPQILGAIGTVVGKKSKSKAKKDALAICALHNGRNCKIMLAYYNQYAAVAVDDRGLAVRAHASTREEAENLALTGFDPGDSSTLVYSACSLPERIQ